MQSGYTFAFALLSNLVVCLSLQLPFYNLEADLKTNPRKNQCIIPAALQAPFVHPSIRRLFLFFWWEKPCASVILVYVLFVDIYTIYTYYICKLGVSKTFWSLKMNLPWSMNGCPMPIHPKNISSHSKCLFITWIPSRAKLIFSL